MDLNGNFFHLFLVAPWLFWQSRNPQPQMLFGAAVLVAAVHGYLILQKTSSKVVRN